MIYGISWACASFQRQARLAFRRARLQGIGTALIALTICAFAGSSVWAQQDKQTPAEKATSGASTSAPSGSTAGAESAAKTAETQSKTEKGGAKATPSAATMQIKKDAPGEFLYRFVTSTNDSSAPAPLPAATGTDNVIALTIPSDIKPRSAQLEVVDVSRGNVARLPVDTKGVTSLTDSSFKYVQAVVVPVQSSGKGVYGAVVTLTDAGKKFRRSHLLAQADNGVARFENVPLGGPITVTVSYGGHPTKSLIETPGLDHPADGYHVQAVAVDWPDVKTVTPPPTVTSTTTSTPSGESRPSAPAPETGPGNAIAGTIVSLLFLGVIGYGLYWAVTTGRAKTLLDKLGIQAQPVTASGPAAPNPFTKPAKPPIQPITEGTADPLIAGAAVGPGVGAAPPLAGSGPRLVATMGTYAGTVFPIGASSIDIGRDASNGVAMPQDTNASRRHATIQQSNGQYTVTDNNSSNGTYVNGVRINSQAPQPLHPGDEVQIGMTRFRFEA